MDCGSEKTVCLDLLGLKGLRGPGAKHHLHFRFFPLCHFYGLPSVQRSADRDIKKALRHFSGACPGYQRKIQQQPNHLCLNSASTQKPFRKGSLAFVDHDSNISLAHLSAFTITGSLHDFNYLLSRVTFPMMCSLNSCSQLYMAIPRPISTNHPLWHSQRLQKWSLDTLRITENHPPPSSRVQGCLRMIFSIFLQSG